MKLIIPRLGAFYKWLEPMAYPLVRITAGLLLVPYGAQKLFGWFGGNAARILDEFHALGFEPAAFFVGASGVIEFFGGLLLALGLLTRPVALVCAGMLGVTVYVTSAAGWFAMGYPLLWTAVCMAIGIQGGGPLSLDSALGREL